jgi:predicted transposase YbfD/YdcC
LLKELGMDAQATAVFLRYFVDLKDPRRHNVRHVFTDIVTIAILAVLCKSDDWTEVVEWAGAQRAWLETFLALPSGIPSADTFRRVFARVDPAGFERCFAAWTAALAGSLAGKLISFDGKALRRSFEHAWAKHQALHLVSAWCAENELVLGQVAVDAKSNEITAIPALLDLLAVKGATVSIDAMGCQREIAAAVVGKGADYLLAVKDNQPALCQKVQSLADEAALEQSKESTGPGGGPPGMRYGYHEQSEDGHGRVETRRVWVTDEVHGLGAELLGQWAGLAAVAVVEATRQDLGDMTGKVTTERRYYITSIDGCDAGRIGRLIRGHWGVENRLHWRLDVAFREDDSRLRKGHGAQNFSRLRRIVLNQLKNDPRKVSLKVKRYRCSIDREYLIDRLRQ